MVIDCIRHIPAAPAQIQELLVKDVRVAINSAVVSGKVGGRRELFKVKDRE